MSVTLNTIECELSILRDCKIFDDIEDGDNVPIPNFSDNAINHLIEFCRLTSSNEMVDLDDLKPIRVEDLSKLFPDDQQKFVDFIRDISDKEIFDLANLADFVSNKQLVDLCLARIAEKVINFKTEEEKIKYLKCE